MDNGQWTMDNSCTRLMGARVVCCPLFIVHKPNMSQITTEEIKKLFALARLPLDENLIALRQKDMEEILGYVASLSKLDTSSAKEVHGGVDFLNAFRVDEVKTASKAERDAVVKSFPTSEADLNKVLGIMEK